MVAIGSGLPCSGRARRCPPCWRSRRNMEDLTASDDTRSVAPALRLFLWSRAAIWLLALVAVVGFDGALNARRGEWDSARLHDLGVVIDVWARWDSDWFLRIADGRLLLAVQHAGVLSALPVPRRGARLGPRRPPRPRRRRRLARRRGGRLRSALPADRDPARRGCGPSHRAVPRRGADVAVLRGGLQRVAVPPARGGGLSRCRAGPVRARRRGSPGSRC